MKKSYSQHFWACFGRNSYRDGGEGEGLTASLEVYKYGEAHQSKPYEDFESRQQVAGLDQTQRGTGAGAITRDSGYLYCLHCKRAAASAAGEGLALLAAEQTE